MDDPRTGTLIKEWTENSSDAIVLVGFPFDEGVRRNGGRVGARGGPSNVRPFIKKIGTVVNPELGISIDDLNIYDSGDILVKKPSNLENGHKLLEERIYSIIKNNSIPFVIGGGNDQSFPNAMGLLRNCNEDNSVVVVNIDAHLDVRPLKEGKVHSGSPFYQLLNSDEWKSKGAGFVEFAAQGSQCSNIHSKYVKDNGGKICWFSELRKQSTSDNMNLPFNNNTTVGLLKDYLFSFDKRPSKIFLSFDIDSIQGSDCPGVSCPATVGLTAEEALDICYWAGKTPEVSLVDISEYNPAIESYRTGRLVANMFYYFLLGRKLR